jgi:hypothetical protein
LNLLSFNPISLCVAAIIINLAGKKFCTYAQMLDGYEYFLIEIRPVVRLPVGGDGKSCYN